jgi:hypothetical protein
MTHYPPSPVGDGVGHGYQTRVIQPGGLPDRSAYLQLEELVFTKPAARAATRGPTGRARTRITITRIR